MAADLGILIKSPVHVGNFVKHEIVAPLNCSLGDLGVADDKPHQQS